MNTNLSRGIYQITCARLIKCQWVKNQVGCCQKAPFFLNIATKWQHIRLRRFSRKNVRRQRGDELRARGVGSSRREISVHSPSPGGFPAALIPRSPGSDTATTPL